MSFVELRDSRVCVARENRDRLGSPHRYSARKNQDQRLHQRISFNTLESSKPRRASDERACRFCTSAAHGSTWLNNVAIPGLRSAGNVNCPHTRLITASG